MIRPATADDAAALAELLGQLGYPAPAGDMPRRLALLRDDDRSEAFVADDDGVVVGLATTHTEVSLTRGEAIGQLTALVVKDGYRGAGAGRQLVSAFEEWARARGCRKLVVTTANHREGAHRFYDRLGWEWTGRRYVKMLQ